MGRIQLSTKDDERFRSKIVRNDQGCHIWQAAKNASGYGWFRLRDRAWLAHRVAFERWVRPVRPDFVLHHRCENPSCVNPEHLEEVSHHTHNRLGDTIPARNARKTHCPQGHEYSAKNTGTYAGKRYCRECKRIRGKLHLVGS